MTDQVADKKSSEQSSKILKPIIGSNTPPANLKDSNVYFFSLLLAAVILNIGLFFLFSWLNFPSYVFIVNLLIAVSIVYIFLKKLL
jgi:hypothetical protein